MTLTMREETATTHTTCTSKYTDGAYAWTFVGPTAQYCNFGAGARTHQRVTITNRDATAETRDDQGNEISITLDLETGTLSASSGETATCREASAR